MNNFSYNQEWALCVKFLLKTCDRSAQLLNTSLSVREVLGSIPGPIKSNTAWTMACNSSDVSLELCCSGAKPQRWTPPLDTRFDVMPQVRDETGQNFLDPIGKTPNLLRLNGYWPVWSTVFFTEFFCSVFNMGFLMTNCSLRFVTRCTEPILQEAARFRQNLFIKTFFFFYTTLTTP